MLVTCRPILDVDLSAVGRTASDPDRASGFGIRIGDVALFSARLYGKTELHQLERSQSKSFLQY